MTADRFPVEATHIMMFARALGDSNPAFQDGSVAPPTFAMAAMQFDPSNPLIPKPDEPWFGSGRGPGFAREGGTGGLHAEQIFEYHKPLHAGMVLEGSTRAGETWEKTSKRGGKLEFSETVTEYRDADSGELVVTVTMVGVMTQRSADQEA